ncbi:hypothetical protein [Streptomyces noursei]|uniref:hypothetical protein n=1 Tax=Streptomyces noursei TaxID=1971 RepID=UPI00167A3AF5|nr:hypothetical protein [Streptomyces noursei]MCZ1015640.1 hypothetical protein [Streptomyces noursei]GGW89679.1 hypothetical protein GCM10010341_08170 [Streptomyces noursei]
MPNTPVKTAQQAAREVRTRLELGLRRAKVSAESVVASGVVEGFKVTRIRLASLSLEETQLLTIAIGGQITRSKDPLARVVAEELDAALRRINICSSPSSVVIGTVNGITANKVLPPSLSIPNARRLATALERGDE